MKSQQILKASIRAKVEHPFRVIKRQFGFTKVRYRGLEEERGAGADAVRAEQSVDGAAQTDGERGMSAPEMAWPGDFAGFGACSRAVESTESADA
jgi:hypothetical protein